jgi:LmbE family N-acetylglucosaminyl deacetylase
MKGIQTILVLGPHTDDGEFGCGGTMARMIEEGKDVYYATFSCAEESVPEGLPKDILLKEVKEASKILGIADDHLLIYRYRVRYFDRFRQEILEDLVQLNRKIQPDLVLMPSDNDLHQDHFTIANEGLRAFKFTSILGYEMPWNNINFQTTSFVYLQEHHVETKLKSVMCYRSQTGRKYANADYIKGHARTRGVQIGVDFAEAFDVKRWVIK